MEGVGEGLGKVAWGLAVGGGSGLRAGLREGAGVRRRVYDQEVPQLQTTIPKC